MTLSVVMLISRRHPSVELFALAISYVLIALYLSLMLLAFSFCANSNAMAFNTDSITLFPLHSGFSNRGEDSRKSPS